MPQRRADNVVVQAATSESGSAGSDGARSRFARLAWWIEVGADSLGNFLKYGMAWP